MVTSRKIVAGLTGLVFAGSLGLGATAFASGHTDGVSSAPVVGRACANAEKIHARAAKIEIKVASRTSTLDARRTAAVASGDTAAVTRIDHRLARLIALKDRVEQRAARFDKWAAEHCAAAPAPTPAAAG